MKITTRGTLVRPLGRTIGYDPSAPTGELPDPVDYADDAGWFIPVSGAGFVSLVNSFGNTAITNTFTGWGFTPTAGNLLVIGVAIRDGGSSAAPSGWTLLEDNAPAAGTGFDDGVALYAKVSDGTETSVTFAYTNFVAGMHRIILEISGLSLAGALTNEVIGASGTAITTGSVTPTAGAQAFIVGLSGSVGAGVTHTPGAGWTELYDAALGGPAHPSTTLIYQIVSSASGSYNPSTTQSGANNWRGVTAAFVEPAEAVYLPAFAINDGSDTTFDQVYEAGLVAAGGVICYVVFGTDIILASGTIRLALEDSGATTIDLEGATDEAFTSPDVLTTLSFTATGSYTAQDVAFTLPATTGYQYLRFVLTSASQGVRVHEVTFAGIPDPGTAIDEHVADTTDAHDASAISLLDTDGNTAETTVEGAIAELYGLLGIWRPVMAHDGTNWYVVVDGDGTAVMAQG